MFSAKIPKLEDANLAGTKHSEDSMDSYNQFQIRVIQMLWSFFHSLVIVVYSGHINSLFMFIHCSMPIECIHSASICLGSSRNARSSSRKVIAQRLHSDDLLVISLSLVEALTCESVQPCPANLVGIIVEYCRLYIRLLINTIGSKCNLFDSSSINARCLACKLSIGLHRDLAGTGRGWAEHCRTRSLWSLSFARRVELPISTKKMLSLTRDCHIIEKLMHRFIEHVWCQQFHFIGHLVSGHIIRLE